MKNRLTELINKGIEKEFNPKELRTFFLSCEFKPNSRLFSILDPFAYDIKPAFIYGSLGIISYTPMAYSIIDIDSNAQPLIGYILTITEPNTVELLKKIKGYHGPEAFNFHQIKMVQAYTDINVSEPAWAFQLSEYVLENYEQIEQVEFGLWDETDEEQIGFLEKIGESL